MKKIYLILCIFCFSILAKAQSTYTFTCPTTTTTWTVPPGVTSINIDIRGASGGTAGTGLVGTQVPGKGGRVQATLAVVPGTVLNIYVGGVGVNGSTAGAAGGFNGGGNASAHIFFGSAVYSGGGGGGASDIRIGGIALANRVAIAAGGGGCGWDGSCPTGGQPGGDGGGLIGATASTCSGLLMSYGYYIIDNAYGGTQVAGGAGGWIDDGSGSYMMGTAGTLGQGGSAVPYDPGIAGGGGGGYYGGGGGCWMGGGGGSSYTNPLVASAVTLTSGYNSGCGMVIINVPGCSGTPTAGTVSASPSTGCGTYTSTLTLTGSSSGAGITYQWQSSPDGITWTNIPGATNATYTGTISANTYYQCIVTCTTSGISSTSTSIECLYYPVPVAILGSVPICAGNTITLTDATGGGTWSSGSGGIATIGSSSGVVTGVSIAGGTTTIVYTSAGGCTTTTVVTVNPTPVAITGTPSVCTGSTTTLSDLTAGGTWSSSNPSIATVSTTGVVSGIASGTTTITYMLGSCYVTLLVTVNNSPAAITGVGYVCTGYTTPLNDVTTGGTWSSFSPGIASVGGTGIVTGNLAGTTTISYTIGTCYAVTTVTVNATPSAIAGPSTVCAGHTVTLTDVAGGTWSSTVPSVATIGSSTGYVNGIVAGTTTISYIMPTGCYITSTETVDSLPTAISGITHVCVAATTVLTDAGGGFWSSSNTAIATAGAGTGIITGVAAGADTITYTLGTGCATTVFFTVNPLPAAIGANTPVCVGSTITVTDATAGGTWGITGTQATINSGTGVVTGVAMGNPVITYTNSTTMCYKTAIVTVNPLPTAIAGVFTLCLPSTSTFTDAMGGGTFSSSNTGICTIGAGSGIATTVAAGIDTLTYTITGTGCKISTQITVTAPPATIAGPSVVCSGQMIALTDSVSGGIWTSGSMANATIDSFSGWLTGSTSGTALITYALGQCIKTKTITINPLPANIMGSNNICTNGSTATITDATLGGTWTSSNTAIATVAGVGADTGVVTSIVAGTFTITYTLPTSCYISLPFTINPIPSPITGTDTVCLNATTTLYDASAGGTFTALTPSIASVSSAGVVSGNAPGIATIYYTVSSTGCKVSTMVMVNATLFDSIAIRVSPNDTICEGMVDTFFAHIVNGGSSPSCQWWVNTSVVGGTGNSYSYVPVNGDIIKCILTSNAQCRSSNTVNSNAITMTVIPTTIPTLTMYPQHQADTVCVGVNQNFTVHSTQGGTSPTFLWTVNWTPVTGIGLHDSGYSYIPNNGDIIRCGMRSSSQCPIPDTVFAIDTMVVKVYDTPRVAILNLAAPSTCQGNFVTLTSNPTWGGWGPHFYWSVNGTYAGTGATYTYQPTDSDVVSCTLISNYWCPSPNDTATTSVALVVDPVIIVTVVAPGVLITRGDNDTFTALVQNGGDNPTYQWLKNGMILAGANNYKYITNSLNDKDSISCEVTTGDGSACVGVVGHSWMVVNVAPAGVNTIANGISNLVIAPNPNTGIFTVEGTIATTTQDIRFQIIDVLGRVVYQETVMVQGGQLHHAINLENKLANGSYLLRITDDNQSKVLRFTINR